MIFPKKHMEFLGKFISGGGDLGGGVVVVMLMMVIMIRIMKPPYNTSPLQVSGAVTRLTVYRAAPHTRRGTLPPRWGEQFTINFAVFLILA